ncbi:exodeoxyribonuclease 7 large subunit [Clostridium homopropionicum DSM 5847]|uniref:Exodeoxyribonuclease 7 large subunit n=1 Tax=Clostridium homopropionicum DSM 5847 TaxID=1121318 RepID=A0A0L6ZDR7_9CLOT|nr:exodeoxyribonuclease VII large subunit [Clostridium homopropionicum]KOA20938.1 exodeoxyribonuclease 7 large subunit [Clostridium homopropionicum DSM 5847]SFG01768.1 Exodeoxyribonuclease VII large subunit [Clostridium homopropionicum]
MQIKTLTVSQLNTYIKKIFDNDFILRNASIKGEISNIKLHSTGHIYFSLKDQQSKINCIMFKTYTNSLDFIPENGDNVIIRGRVSLYHSEGVYQFYCEEMKKEGIGDLHIAFENLKNKLIKEGLFDQKYKKQIPKFLNKIGIITSPTGAAIRDIINVSRRRNPNIDILIYPSLVQGTNASNQLIEGIRYLDKREDIDLIILARGGGSIEELWAFNDEALAYEIFNCKKPIVSAIGHETDFTIADFVSDLRAPTPSAAAEITVYSLEDLTERIESYTERLKRITNSTILNKTNYFNIQFNKLKLNNPINFIANEYIRLDNIKERLKLWISTKIEKKKEYISKCNSLLEANNPMNIIDKGFSIIHKDKNKLVTKVDEIKQGDLLKVYLRDGSVSFTVNLIEKNKRT